MCIVPIVFILPLVYNKIIRKHNNCPVAGAYSSATATGSG
nr:MAG TPA: hypothetical protein [Caudoviricetes sp.]